MKQDVSKEIANATVGSRTVAFRRIVSRGILRAAWQTCEGTGGFVQSRSGSSRCSFECGRAMRETLDVPSCGRSEGGEVRASQVVDGTSDGTSNGQAGAAG